VNTLGVPAITLDVAGQSWNALIDTGFNGDLELPRRLRTSLGARWIGTVTSILAAGQTVDEDRYQLPFSFDGKVTLAEATFVACEEILIGTHLLRDHRLEINFVTKDVLIERVR
jgi:predicted aspartyl protease